MQSQGKTSGPKTQASLRQETAERDRRRELFRARWRRRWTLVKRSVKLTILLVVFSALVWILRDRIFISVEPGNVMVVYHLLWGGTSGNEVFGEGLHLLLPWDTPTIYSIRSQALVVPMDVLSNNGLEIKLDAQVRFHAVRAAVPNLHRRYGPDYVKAIIIPQLTESVQEIIGASSPEQMYALQHSANVDRFWNHTKRTIGGVYVGVEDIALFNIRLPQRVQDAIQAKAEAEQQALAYQFLVQREEQEQQRKAKEATTLASYIATVREIPRSILVWKGIEATLELSKSSNAKVIVMGTHDNLPLMLGNVPDLVTK